MSSLTLFDNSSIENTLFYIRFNGSFAKQMTLGQTKKKFKAMLIARISIEFYFLRDGWKVGGKYF